MAERYDYNQEHALVDGVDDAVVSDADPHPEAGTTMQSSCARRAGILTEEGDRPVDARLVCRVDAPQSLERGGPNLDSVLAHSAPAEIGFDQRIHHALVLGKAWILGIRPACAPKLSP